MISNSLLPAVATATLAAALAMPLRDGRRNRHASSADANPLEVRFAGDVVANETDDEACASDGNPERAFRAILLEKLAAREETGGTARDPGDTQAADAVVETLGPANAASHAVGTSALARFLRYLFPLPSIGLEAGAIAPRDVTETADAIAFEPTTPGSDDDAAFAHELRSEATAPAGSSMASPASSTAGAQISAETNVANLIAPFRQVDAENEYEACLAIPQRSIPLPTERAVPLTRRRLRTSAARFTWPEACDPPASFESDAQRRAFLLEICVTPRPSLARAIEQAFVEEPHEYRRAALGALVKLASPTSASTFVTALRTGEDDERVAALDGLIRLKCFDELPTAFDDRCDAIAAKAALAFIAVRERDAFARRLSDFVDPARCERIVALLAGVLR